MTQSNSVDALVSSAAAFRGSDQLDEAERALREALDLSPQFGPAWLALGELHVLRREWEEALICLREAVTILPNVSAAWWNLGFVATAMRDWPTARSAWIGCGMSPPGDEGPPVWYDRWGIVRLRARRREQIVWAWRLDPVRAVIRALPLPETGHRYGDTVLHSWIENGTHPSGNHVLPVYDAIERLQVSTTPTLQAEMVIPSHDDAIALIDMISESGWTGADWTRPSSDNPLRWGESSNVGEWTNERTFGIAAPLDEAIAILTRWSIASSQRETRSIVQVF